MEYKKQTARFFDGKSNLLEIITKQMKADNAFQCVAYLTPKNGKRQRGCVGVYTDAEAALQRYTALCAEAEKAKWQRKLGQPKGVSTFDSIPKAAA